MPNLYNQNTFQPPSKAAIARGFLSPTHGPRSPAVPAMSPMGLFDKAQRARSSINPFTGSMNAGYTLGTGNGFGFLGSFSGITLGIGPFAWNNDLSARDWRQDPNWVTSLRERYGLTPPARPETFASAATSAYNALKVAADAGNLAAQDVLDGYVTRINGLIAAIDQISRDVWVDPPGFDRGVNGTTRNRSDETTRLNHYYALTDQLFALSKETVPPAPVVGNTATGGSTGAQYFTSRSTGMRSLIPNNLVGSGGGQPNSSLPSGVNSSSSAQTAEGASNLPLILGGVGALAVVGLGIYLLKRK